VPEHTDLESPQLAEARLRALEILRAKDTFRENLHLEASPMGVVMRALPHRKHRDIVSGLRHQLAPLLPPDVIVEDGNAFLVGPGIERTPDLVVIDRRRRAAHQRGRAVDASGVWMFVEVTSRTTRVTDLREKPREYAAAGVPVMLIVDRRERRAIMHYTPTGWGYADARRAQVGETIRLPEPFDTTLDTAFIEEFLD
jgi:Uma2 family endonuclease